MRIRLVLGLMVAAVITLTLLWLAFRDSRGDGGAPNDGPTSVQSAESPKEAATAATADVPATASREAAPPRGEVSSSATNAALEASAKGRFVDKSGATVEGVKVYKTVDPEGVFYHDIERLPDLASTPAESGADGVFRWAEPAPANAVAGRRVTREAVALKRGYARTKLYIYMELEYGKEVSLGDFVLEPGGDLAGVVRDPQGRPAAGVTVKLVDAEALASIPLEEWQFRQMRVKSLRGAHTQLDGSFAMAGAPVGSLCLVADHADLGTAISEPFELQSGDVLDAFVLTLRPPRPDGMVEGKVVNPSGVGVGATVEVSSKNGSGASFQTSDDGTFRWRCIDKGPFTIFASDNEQEFGGARAEGVKAGTRDLKLILTERRDLVVEMVSDAGEPIHTGSVNIHRSEGMVGLNFSIRTFDPPGRVILPVPPVPFSVEVRSPGHSNVKTATIDPASLPQPLRVVLRKLPTIEGRVVSGGKPVKGAWVALHVARAGARRNGFPARMAVNFMENIAPVETGADGTFSIAPTSAVKLTFLRASATRIDAFENARNPQNLAPAEFGPFEYDGRTPVKGIEIVMTPGGGIAGKLRLPAGRSAAGQSIGASNGDSHPVTTKTREDGSFEFMQLTPGRYGVKWMDGIDYGDSASPTTPTEVVNVPWNCVVEEGAVTAFDLDYSLTSDPAVLLEVKLGSLVPAGAKVSLDVKAQGGGPATTLDAVLDAEGRARIPLTRGCDVRLTIRYAAPNGVDYEIRTDGTVDAHGDSRIAVSVPAGILRGTAPATIASDTKLTFDKLGAPPYVRFTIDVKPSTPFEVDPAPAGPISVKLPDGKLVKVTVTAGGVAELKWP